jgi:hypothetical protein
MRERRARVRWDFGEEREMGKKPRDGNETEENDLYFNINKMLHTSGKKMMIGRMIACVFFLSVFQPSTDMSTRVLFNGVQV